MEKKDLNRLKHILDAAKTIQEHIKEKKQSDLDKNRLFLGGVIRELLVIGEASNAVSSHIRVQIPIPWKEVIGMRNQLVHAYFEINRKIIWMTIREDIPKLVFELEKFLNKISD